ncbi:MAG: bifunctional phosphoribosylaminoimidazolecarboxamide formyltransferase/IMP cyclohydrolase [Gammaproteobacteria bacterium]
MNSQTAQVKRVLLSVSDKTNLVEFARGLADLDIELISTGGTSKLLREANIPVRDVSDVTHFPEIMDGRLKTLHPKVHGGILGKRDAHLSIAKQHDINWIDLVVVNLYPFAETIKRPNVEFSEAIENIDIGGPTMIRSAAKNMEWVGVVVDPNDYATVLTEIRTQNGLSFASRRRLATKAFGHTAQYDALINRYLEESKYTDHLTLNLEKVADLRYGENPHQAACAYQLIGQHTGILSAKQHQGKQLSYNNITDADAAVACVREFLEPACVIVKHANPCGAAVADNIYEAFQRAFNADAQSAFGGIVALNQTCTREVAEAIAKLFIEVLIAPAYEAQALEILTSKANLRVLEIPMTQDNFKQELKFVEGGLLVQDRDLSVIKPQDLKVVTTSQPTTHEIHTMTFTWRVLKHIKSNAILITKENVTLGVGAGQVSRVDAVELAIRKAGKDLSGTVLASDAFFPFRDSIDHIAKTGVRAIIQPGGSMRDEEVIAACNENNIAMVFTGQRCFKH